MNRNRYFTTFWVSCSTKTTFFLYIKLLQGMCARVADLVLIEMKDRSPSVGGGGRRLPLEHVAQHFLHGRRSQCSAEENALNPGWVDRSQKRQHQQQPPEPAKSHQLIAMQAHVLTKRDELFLHAQLISISVNSAVRLCTPHTDTDLTGWLECLARMCCASMICAWSWSVSTWSGSFKPRMSETDRL